MPVAAELGYVSFNTGIGWIAVLASSRGLVRVILPQPSAGAARRLLSTDAARSPDLFGDLVPRFTAYFGGRRMSFADKLDLSGATEFQRRVWETVRQIPYGETKSYCWVAQQIGRPGAARAVGQSLAGNPLPIIIPCHRVVTAGGRVGGYSGGVEMKKYLLRLEASAR